jgi:hypothetical protein
LGEFFALEKIVLWENFAGAKFSPKFFWGRNIYYGIISPDFWVKFLGKFSCFSFGEFCSLGKFALFFWGYNIL